MSDPRRHGSVVPITRPATEGRADEMDPVSAAMLFSGANPADVAAVTRQMPTVEFDAQHTIYSPGDRDDRLYVVVLGKVTLARYRSDGRRMLLGVLGPSEVFGELAAFDPGPRTACASALTAVRALSMDRPLLQQWLRTHPEICEQVMRVMARRLRRTDYDRGDLVFTDVAGRVAKVVLRLAQRFGVQHDGATRVVHDLTHDDLAQLVGTSRESICKALTEFAAEGWLRPYGKKGLLVIDSDSLTRRAQLAPSANQVDAQCHPADQRLQSSP